MPDYKLIPDTVSRNVVEALKTLLEGAEGGTIIGISFVAVLKQRRYVTNVAGFCHRNPTHARGMVQSLDDKLKLLVENCDPEDTR